MTKERILEIQFEQVYDWASSMWENNDKDEHSTMLAHIAGICDMTHMFLKELDKVSGDVNGI